MTEITAQERMSTWRVFSLHPCWHTTAVPVESLFDCHCPDFPIFGAMSRPIGARCNEIWLAADCARSPIGAHRLAFIRTRLDPHFLPHLLSLSLSCRRRQHA